MKKSKPDPYKVNMLKALIASRQGLVERLSKERGRSAKINETRITLEEIHRYDRQILQLKHELGDNYE